MCIDCVQKVPAAIVVCPYCYKPSIDGVTHSKCKKKFGLDGIVSVWEYEGVVRKAVLSLKYKYATEVGRELSEHFYLRLSNKRDSLPRFDVLTPVPLYWYKENVRGFNQSKEFGIAVSQKLDCEFVSNFLVRKKHTKPQARLKREERKSNLNDAFGVSSEHANNVIKSLLIIDDVFTTGSTLKECAKVAKRNGVDRVWGLTLASRSRFFG